MPNFRLAGSAAGIILELGVTVLQMQRIPDGCGAAVLRLHIRIKPGAANSVLLVLRVTQTFTAHVIMTVSATVLFASL